MSDSEWRPGWTRKQKPKPWKTAEPYVAANPMTEEEKAARKKPKPWVTEVPRAAPPKPKTQSVDLLRAIALDAMTHPTPVGTREELRERCIRGLLGIADNAENDTRARAVCFKAVLDHTDKMADREEDYSALTNDELKQRILEHARKLVAENEGIKALPAHVPDEEA